MNVQTHRLETESDNTISKTGNGGNIKYKEEDHK